MVGLINVTQAQSDGQVLTREDGGASWQDNEVSTIVRAKRTSTMVIPSSTYTTVTYTNKDFDINGAFNHTTGIFTPPEAGFYVIMASVQWENNNSSTGRRSITLVKDGSLEVERNVEDGNNRMHSSIHTIIESDGTDDYQIQAWQNSGLDHNIGGHVQVDRTVFTAYKIKSQEEYLTKMNEGASWGEKRTCFKVRKSSPMSVISSATPQTVTYSGEEFDVNDNFDESTGIFTPPKAGYYVIMATANWHDNNTNSGVRSILLLREDKSTNPFTSSIMEENAESGAGVITSSIHTVVYSNGSDNYRIQVRQNSGSDHDIGNVDGMDGCLFAAFSILDQDLVLKREDGGATWKAINASNRSCIRAKRTSDLTTTSNNQITVTSTIEDFDTNGDFDHTTGVFTPPEAGYYVIKATVNWQGNNSVSGLRRLILVKNLTNNVEDANETGESEMISSLHTVIYSDGTDNYRIRAAQTTGSDQDIGGSTAAPGCVFTAYRLD